MKPSGVKTNPDPEPAGVSPRRISTFTTDGLARPAASITASEYASSKSSSGGCDTGIAKSSDSIASSDTYARKSPRQPAASDRAFLCEDENVVPSARIHSSNPHGVNNHGDYVLYWMIANRRRHWNFALQRAVHWATELRKPLLVVESLSCGYRWASVRIHTAILQG